MKRLTLSIKISRFILLAFTLTLPLMIKAQNILNDISFKSKNNGIIVEFYFENSISADSIYAWQSDNDWFYFTLHNIISDTSYLRNNTYYERPVIAFQPIVNDKITQIGLRLSQRVDSFELYKKKKTNLINAHLHYSVEKFRELALINNENKINKDPENVYSRLKTWMFLIGSGYVITGMSSQDKDNKNLEIGLTTIFLTYILDKIFFNN